MDFGRCKRPCIVENCNSECPRRYKFPTYNDNIKKIWMDRIDNNSIRNFSNEKLHSRVFVCGGHFMSVCKGRKFLSRNALPTINIPGFHEVPTIENSFYSNADCHSQKIELPLEKNSIAESSVIESDTFKRITATCSTNTENQQIPSTGFNKEMKVKFSFSGRTIIYTDESLVNIGHSATKTWTDTTIKSSRQAFCEGLTTGLKSPSSFGPRFALVHAERIQPMHITKWMEKKVEQIPTTVWKKDQIIEWLALKQSPVEDGMLKRDLLFTVSQVKSQYEKYKLDLIAIANDCEIPRLPPYHCDLNPVEMVWAQS
ncbi:THAP domain [Popillia japonica]|uniref:THAP domain n=1 Tax=Popillia japonica TaxID=7064 RepID=A0AAW1KJU8_POPJA